jgi:hypothetical protein
MTTSAWRRALTQLSGNGQDLPVTPPARNGYSVYRRALAGLLGVRLAQRSHDIQLTAVDSRNRTTAAEPVFPAEQGGRETSTAIAGETSAGLQSATSQAGLSVHQSRPASSRQVGISRPAITKTEAEPSPLPAGTVVQWATAAGSSLVNQAGRDLHVSEERLHSLQVTSESPYPGLSVFRPDEARWFFGRERVTAELLLHLDEMIHADSGEPLVVVGSSGAGKSSLLQAGLMGALAEGRLPEPGSASWPRVLLTPGGHPAHTLRTARAALASGESISGDSRAVVVIDDLEEIFTLTESESERAEFLDEIDSMAAASGPGEALVVAALRADYYARATAYPVLRRALQSRQVVLGAMSAAEVEQVIVRPAVAAGLTLEPGLVAVLMRDLGVTSRGDGYEPWRLPLLAHALRRTWQRREGSHMTIAAYESTGGIAGGIAVTAEDVYSGLDNAGRAEARRLFRGLVRVGDIMSGNGIVAVTRRPVTAESLLQQAADPVTAHTVLEAFAAARLLTFGKQAVLISHEALLDSWPRLRSWIDSDLASLLVQQELEDAATSWANAGQDPSYLLRGVRLTQAQASAADLAKGSTMTELSRTFITASWRRQRHHARLSLLVIATLIALVLALTVLLVLALR